MTGINHTEANLRTQDGEDIRESSMSRSMNKEHVEQEVEKVGWHQIKESLKSPNKFYFILQVNVNH